jgi:hypothetical protein
MRLLPLAIALAVILSGSAAAQSRLPPKRPNVALAWSLGGSAASAGVLALGVATNQSGLALTGLFSSLVTPSFGHFYADDPLTWGLPVRIASFGIMFWGLMEALDCQDNCTSNKAGVIFGAGLLTLGGGMLYDIVQAPAAARRYNERHGLQLTLSPTFLRAAHDRVPALGLSGAF